MKKIKALFAATVLSLSACSQEQVQVFIKSQQAQPEAFTNILENSSKLCAKLNGQNIKCVIKIQTQQDLPLQIKVWNNSDKLLIKEFTTENDLVKKIKNHLKN